MNALSVPQWLAVSAVMDKHCLNPQLAADVRAECDAAVASRPETEPEKEE